MKRKKQEVDPKKVKIKKELDTREQQTLPRCLQTGASSGASSSVAGHAVASSDVAEPPPPDRSTCDTAPSNVAPPSVAEPPPPDRSTCETAPSNVAPPSVAEPLPPPSAPPNTCDSIKAESLGDAESMASEQASILNPQDIDMAKFHNNIRSPKCPEWLKKAWESFRSLPQKSKARQNFVSEVASIIDKQYDKNEYLMANFNKTRTVETEDTEGTGGGWFSYDFVVQKEGKLVTDEMLRLKTIQSRLHKGLVEGQHQVPLPHCLELKWTKELFSYKSKNKDSVTLEDTKEASPEERHAILAAMPKMSETSSAAALEMGSRNYEPSEAAYSSTSIDGGELPDSGLVQKVTIAMKNASKAHSEWDRAKRQWNATLAMSAANPRTKDTQTHTELQDIIVEASKLDEKLAAIETKYKANLPIDLGMIEEVREMCDEVYRHKKEGGVRSNMLIAWIRMKNPTK